MENQDHNTPQPPPFDEVFRQAINDLEASAKAAGSNMTEVCREAQISRTTPDRWKQRPPATVALVAKLQKIVADKAAEQAPAQAAE